MPDTKLTLEAETELVLNELWREALIPFALHVGKITKQSGKYTIHFYDSRMATADILLTPHSSYRDMVRTGVLARVTKLSGPLENWHLKTHAA